MTKTTRIRYELRDVEKEIYISSKPFKVANKSYQVHLDKRNLRYEIKNVNNNKIALSGISTSFDKLKKNARSGLKNLGVRFKRDVRKRNTATQ